MDNMSLSSFHLLLDNHDTYMLIEISSRLKFDYQFIYILNNGVSKLINKRDVDRKRESPSAKLFSAYKMKSRTVSSYIT
jgi:hypothetical protein